MHESGMVRGVHVAEELSMAVVAPVNDETCLAENLAASPMFQEMGIPLVVQQNHASAGEAYNAGLDHTDADIVVFAHQDVYFPRGWEQKLVGAIQQLECEGKQWGVLGVIGADANGNLVGGAWSTGLLRKIESDFQSPAAVRSFDEIVLVIRKDSGLRFDEELPGFHLYGTDIAQAASRNNLGAYVFDAPVIHNSLWRKTLGPSYVEAWRYVKEKWADELPIRTLVLPITRSDWPLWKNWYREKRKWIMRKLKGERPRVRHPDPSRLSLDLGYEYVA